MQRTRSGSLARGRHLGRVSTGYLMDAPKYSIVVPVYNEEESITELVGRLRETMDKLDGPAEALLVNDGSKDSSYRLMLDAHDTDPRFKVIQLSRNSGTSSPSRPEWTTPRARRSW